MAKKNLASQRTNDKDSHLVPGIFTASANWRDVERIICLLAGILFIVAACRPCHAHPYVTEEDEDGPIHHVVAVVKGKADLPCDISPSNESDQANLVLWYKDDGSPSIYTYDARDRFSTRPRGWSDQNTLGGRAYFNTVHQPAILSIDNIRELDAGVYRCRVDFKRSPTRNSRVNLTVTVPPKLIKIIDEKGYEVDDVVGPYDEDATLQLICLVVGGNPQPEVKWWQENRLIGQHSDIRGNEVRNTLRLERLGRQDLRTTLSCQASNTKLSSPLTKSVVIEVNLRPLEVRILSSRQPLSTNKFYEVTCQTVGSRPSAVVTWWKDGVLLRQAQETLFDGGNITLSQLTLQLSPEDDGRRLVCRAENPQLGPSSALEDSWILDVYYIPQVRLELGRNLEKDNIREGTDVYFDCHVIARPNVVRLVWRHQGQILQNNRTAGIYIGKSNLVLQRVSRTAAGQYTCHATNTEGEATSAPFNLDVLHKPVCRWDQKNSYGGAKGLTSEIVCHVESKPASTNFRWAFNGTGEPTDIFSNHHITSNGSTSILRYTPRSELDFGTLLCWATNSMGVQNEPCVYHIYAAGVPDPPNNCSVSNQTILSFEIDCSEGYDGGIPQHFELQVFEMKSQTLLANLTSSIPKFSLHLGSPLPHQGSTVLDTDSPRTHSWKSIVIQEEGESKTLPAQGHSRYGSIAVIPAVGTLLKLTAVNARGSSDAVFLEAASVTGWPAEKQTGPVSQFEFTPTLGILIGIVATGVLMIIGLIVIFKFRCRKQQQEKLDKDKEARKDYIELATKDPDLIVQDKGGDIITHITDNPLDFLNSSIVGIRSGDECGRSSTTSTLPLPETHLSSQEEVVYAELTLSRKSSNIPAAKTMDEAVVYAQIDHNRKTAKHKLEPTIYPEMNHLTAVITSDGPLRETALT